MDGLKERIKGFAATTHSPQVLDSSGSFAGLYQLSGYREPVLVASTDGVGTKIKIAAQLGHFESVGQDLVILNVNDILTRGAKPLFFLDYVAFSNLDTQRLDNLMRGITWGCLEVGCSLIGGETAEMPGMYGDGDYDLAGFSVGAAERGNLLPREDIAPGDRILGLASSGAHSNGFSLVRHVLAQQGLDYSVETAFDAGMTWGETLLTPTRIYVKSCLALHKAGLAKAFAHITGGGLTENVPRILPDGMAARIDPTAWSMPPVFSWLMAEGGVAPAEMARTFNCGIGMVAIVRAEDAGKAVGILTAAGEDVFNIGEIVAQDFTGEASADDAERVALPGLDGAWLA